MTIINPLPYTFVVNTVIDPTQVNADFAQIVNSTNTNAAHNGANSDITSLSGLTTPLSVAQGGTASTTAPGALTSLGAVAKAGDTMTGALTISAAGYGLTVGNSILVGQASQFNGNLTVLGALIASGGGTLTSPTIGGGTITSATITSATITSATISSSSATNIAMGGTWTGTPVFNGNLNFTGSPTFTGTQPFASSFYVGSSVGTLNSCVLGITYGGGATNGISANDANGLDGSAFAIFGTTGTVIGSINNSNNTGVIYNTTSDVRLKTDITPLLGVGALIDSLGPVSWAWKSNGAFDAGFIAQDLINVVPQAVSRGSDMDASPEDEGFRPWGVDASRLVPFLVAEIQSLRKRVAQLEGQKS